MKFHYFRCACGRMLISALRTAKCPVCDKKMRLVNKPSEEAEMDNQFRFLIEKIACCNVWKSSDKGVTWQHLTEKTYAGG